MFGAREFGVTAEILNTAKQLTNNAVSMAAVLVASAIYDAFINAVCNTLAESITELDYIRTTKKELPYERFENQRRAPMVKSDGNGSVWSHT